jgi:hypothetical protein
MDMDKILKGTFEVPTIILEKSIFFILGDFEPMLSFPFLIVGAFVAFIEKSWLRSGTGLKLRFILDMEFESIIDSEKLGMIEGVTFPKSKEEEVGFEVLANSNQREDA